MNAEVGRRPPASPSCRLYLRAGSRRGHRGLRPGGNAEIKRWDGGEGGSGTRRRPKQTGLLLKNKGSKLE